MKWLSIVLLLLTGEFVAAQAAELSLHGMATARVVAPSDEVSWHDGGFGRLRYGAEDFQSFGAPPLDLHIEPHFRLTPSLSGMLSLKFDPEQDRAIDLVEGYAQFRPVSTNQWRWSLKGGAFFPPISFENGDIGWTSSYAVTSSAINSWLGEELRVIGVEGRLEWRMVDSTTSVYGSLYGWNDPLGVLLAVRGWGFTDRSVGLSDRVRLHDVFVTQIGRTPPYSESEIREIDDRVGWYAGAEYAQRHGLTLRGLYYDNRADPAAVRDGQQAWLTQFWSGGAQYTYDRWTFMTQGMTGHTDIDIQPFVGYLKTDFSSAFVLVAYDLGDVRLTGRAEVFMTDETRNGTTQAREEDGSAYTVAARWFLHDHLQVTGELLHVMSDRPERMGAGLAADVEETQIQVTLQFKF